VLDEGGNYLASRSTVYDITRRRRAEMELYNANAFLDSVIDNIPSMIVVKDAKELCYVRLNKAAEAFLGHRQAWLAGKNVYDVNMNEDADRSIANDRAVLAAGRLVELPEQEVSLPDKGRRIIQTTKIPLLSDADGKPQYLLSIGLDITEKKQAEQEIRALNSRLEARASELEATNKELESFSYSISHDLRAPLRAIDGYAQMIEEDYGEHLDSEGARYLSQVREHSKRMGALIDDLLRFSRLGRQAMNCRELDMNALVQEVVADVLRDQDGPPPEIELGALPRAQADGVQMRQVWVNLISNAIKYSGRVERPCIRISGSSGGTEALYSVADNGAGFDMAYYGKLFGVFQRLHSAEEFAGTGVGLAIVQRAVARHGGKVWAEGKVNEGAKFFFTLPTGDHHA
jgi:PAS domain S-box-containing protein